MSYGLYIHLPFCKKRCPYCAFTSTVNMMHAIPDYLEAVRRELGVRLEHAPFSGNPETIYIGGGTPSLVPAKGIADLITDIAGPETTEITVEANPESIDLDWLEGIRNAGANRLSIGIQSFDDAILGRLGRLHDSGIAKRAISHARDAGFDNISIDLMYGVPGQTLTDWGDTLLTAIQLAPEHISCYALSVEEDTGYFACFNDRPDMLPGADTVADMYLLMRDLLGEQGYGWYEISNFAKKGRECLHNMHYWDFTPYLGVGASAHSFNGNERFWNISSPEEYIKQLHRNADPQRGREMVDDRMKLQERIMLSIRTNDGLEMESIQSASPSGELATYIRNLRKMGYAFLKEERLVLTPAGAMLSDEISTDIISLILEI